MSAEQMILAIVGVLIVLPFLARQQIPVKRPKIWIVAPLSFLLAITGVAASYFFSLFIGLLIMVILTGAAGFLFVNSLRMQEAVPAAVESFEPAAGQGNTALRADLPWTASNLLEDDYIPELAYVSSGEEDSERDFESLLNKTNLVKGRS
ncbi:hypothetical protein RFW18_10585 [Metabacillus idriensis]|uniref:hypothetical protein n=1 Tax=Metabacillus idriensis TaxID=324768 RepID=UPI002812F5FF|nr:hypothetical protein [Metabacillus idriensis]MDR0138186.1 hypothetical protein [Metabacillus idriensis]